MRIATGVIALFLTLIVGGAAYLAFVAEIFSSNGVSVWYSSFLLLVMLLFLFGGAFSFKLPNVAFIIFIVSLCITVLMTLLYAQNAWVWALASLVVTVMSYFSSNDTSAETEDENLPKTESV